MLREELIPKVQQRIPSFQSVLTDLFRALLKEANADKGFLAFEDINGNLAIAANKGDFWYLSRDAGATGRAVTSGTPSIADPSVDNRFKETSDRVHSELIYPIKYSGHVIGAILLDNLKKVPFEATTHYPIVERYITKICEVLGDEDPWSFRTWWQDQQKLKRMELLESVHDIVQTVLDQHAIEDNAASIEGRVEAIRHDGNLVLHGSVLGKFFSSRKSDREVVGRALRTGKLIDRPAESRKYECLIPFPMEGPVLGMVTLITPTKETLPVAVLNEIQQRVRELEYQHYAPALPGGRQGAEHYFRLVLTALTAPSSPVGATAALETLARQARALCGEELQVQVSFDTDVPSSITDHVVVTTPDAIIKELNAKEPIERFYCHTGHDWLSCPVFVRDKLRGIVRVRNRDISNLYNSEIVVVVAILVAELLDRVRN